MVSLWKRLEESKPLKLICLGILIRPNWIITTTQCASKSTPFNDTMIQFGGYAVQNILPDETKIVYKEEVNSRSQFSILYVSIPHSTE